MLGCRFCICIALGYRNVLIVDAIASVCCAVKSDIGYAVFQFDVTIIRKRDKFFILAACIAV